MYGLNYEHVDNKFPKDVLNSLLGEKYDFYGVDGNSFCIGRSGSRMVLEALEDPDDGYRSYFGCFRTTAVDKIFFGAPIAEVVFRVHQDDDDADERFSGWVLQDAATGHVWLKVGTDHRDDYYPCFTFDYYPDRSKKVSA